MNWTEARFFVSSTFAEMQPERDLLVKKVVPHLKLLGETKAVHVSEVDLRWGIPTADGEERLLIAQKCLEAVDSCRPFLIGFLGDYRGRKLSAKDFAPKLLQKHPDLQKALNFGLSLTELEILHAAIPLFGSLQPSNVVLYVETSNGKLPLALKKAFRAFGVDTDIAPTGLKVRKYTKRHTDNGPVVLEATDCELESQIIADLEELLGLDAVEELTLQTDRDFHDRAKVLALANTVYWPDLQDTQPELPQERLILVLGKSGSGKTTYMAQFATKLSRDGKRPTIARFFGSVAPADSFDALLLSLCEELAATMGLELVVRSNRELLSTWSRLWSEAKQSTRPLPVLILDALDSAPVNPEALQWLLVPVSFGANVVVSFAPQSTLGRSMHNTLTRVPTAKVRVLSGLSTKQARKDFIDSRLEANLKVLGPEETWALVANESGSDPLFLSVVLAELRLHGRHDNLVEQINLRFAGGRIAAIESFLDRIETEAGTLLVSTVLGAIAHSHSGLATRELVQLCTRALNETSDTLEGRVEELMRSIEAFLQRRPYAYSISTFAVREYISGRYPTFCTRSVPNGEDWNVALAQLLRTADSGNGTASHASRIRRLRDLPAHLRHAGLMNELAEFLLDPNEFLPRINHLGSSGLIDEIDLCLRDTNHIGLRRSLAELRSLLTAAADQLMSLSVSNLSSASQIVQALVLQAGILDLHDLEHQLYECLSSHKRRARVRWTDGATIRPSLIRSYSDWCEQLVASPDGKWLLRVGETSGCILYDVHNMREQVNIGQNSNAQPNSKPQRSCFSPDGSETALAHTEGLDILDTVTGALLRSWRIWSDKPISICWAEYIVVSVRDRLLAIDPQTGSVSACACKNVSAIAAISHRREIVFGTSNGELGCISLPFVDGTDVQLIGQLETACEGEKIAFRDEIIQVVVSETDDKVWTATRKVLAEWSLESGTCELPFAEFRPISDIAVDADGQTLLVATGMGELSVFDLSSYDRKTIKCVQNAALALSVGGDGRIWVSGQPDVDGSEIVLVSSIENSSSTDLVNCLAFSPNGKLAVDGRMWGRVWVRDAKTKLDYFDLEPSNSSQKIFCTRFNRTGEVLFIGSLDRLLLVDPWQHQMIAELGALGAWEATPFDGVRAVGIDPNDKFFVAGDSQGHLVTFNRMYEAVAVSKLQSPPISIEVLTSGLILIFQESGAASLSTPDLQVVRKWPSSGDRAWAMAVAHKSGQFFTSHRGGLICGRHLDREEAFEVPVSASAEIETMQVLDGETVLMVGDRSGRLRFWEMGTWNLALDLSFAGAVENAVVSSKSDNLLLSLGHSSLLSLELEGFEI